MKKRKTPLQQMWETIVAENLRTMKLYEIALEIDHEGTHNYFGARPYIKAMMTLTDLTDTYGQDSAVSIVLYFLANSQTWRGSFARLVKAELNKRLKEFRDGK
jgi:hypothetical protein